MALEPNHKQAFGSLAECAIMRCDWVRREKVLGELCRHVMERSSIIEPFLLVGYSDGESLLLQALRI